MLYAFPKYRELRGTHPHSSLHTSARKSTHNAACSPLEQLSYALHSSQRPLGIAFQELKIGLLNQFSQVWLDPFSLLKFNACICGWFGAQRKTSPPTCNC